MKPVRSLIGTSLCFAAALSVASSVRATPLRPAFDLQGPGLSIAVAGAGMLGPAGRSQTLTVTVGGPVELALLYWAGRDRPCPVDPPGSGQCVKNRADLLIRCIRWTQYLARGLMCRRALNLE